MPKHNEKRIVPYTPAQMYSLVADVESYPYFLPWVSGVTLYNKTDNGFDADLSIGTPLMKHAYSSRVSLQPDINRIDVRHTKGPFHHLNTMWIFNAHNPYGKIADVEIKSTEIEFFLDFELNNPILRTLFQPFLNQAVGAMVSAFEMRAQQLFKG